jgi:hypothetical protein
MSIDIVNLIESNPITKLTGDYQSKLVEKVKNNFTNYEQQLFLSSFYCYLKYDYKNEFVIDLDNVWKWLGFQQKYHAKYLLEKQFIINKDYKILLTPAGEQKKTNFSPEASGAKKETRGGHTKEIIMLNIETFKKYCLKAGTKKADEIHDYFIKLEQIFQEVLLEESEELKQQLVQLENIKNKEMEESLNKQKVMEREQILLKQYEKSGSIFYIMKVKTLEYGQYIIKIGESRVGVLARYKEHKSNYEECLLLDCWTVTKSKEFESFIKEHDLIRGNKVNNLVGHESELELFLIGKNLSYQTLVNIITTNLKYFNDASNTHKLELEIQQLKMMLEMKQSGNETSLIQELTNMVKHLSSKIDRLESSNKDILNKLNAMQTKTTTNFNQPLVTLGPRLQQINPETMLINKVYESVAECLKEYNFKVKRPSIDKAVTENTVYHGYRWAYVDRNKDATILYDISPTKSTKIQNLGYIAKLNIDKTEILEIYLDRKTAAIMNQYQSISALDTPVKNNTLTNGHYYQLYDQCDEFLVNAFEEKNGEPILYKDGIGQYDLENTLLREFVCKYDCIKQLKISDKTLAKALDKNIVYNNCYFKKLGSKLSLPYK